ncbi:MAG: NAD(+)/NADH kinase [Thermoleophilia bacterium]|nr:NAD(+)/NADH kinase [Thermoleophilia bacterium]
MTSDIKRIALLTHGQPDVARESLIRCLRFLAERGVEVKAPAGEWEKHGEILHGAAGVSLASGPQDLGGVGLCVVLGGDGTMLRAFHLTRGLSIPVAGVNLGRVGFLTTVNKDELIQGLEQLLAGGFKQYPLLGLEASLDGKVFRATNDVVVGKGPNPHACSIALTINGVTLFEVMCDGVVVGTPAGSSAYSLAAGGPLLGIAVDAYVISLVAPHAVGVRPVVAAPQDVLEIINTDDENDSSLDVDGERMATMAPGSVVRINTRPGMTSLALLEGDSLFHHFRDRLL